MFRTGLKIDFKKSFFIFLVILYFTLCLIMIYAFYCVLNLWSIINVVMWGF